MNLKIRKEKDVKKLFEIKQIEGIKCSSKAFSMLLKLYDENILLKNKLHKQEEIQRLT
ncbi:hypothetical protein D3C85_322550 [compost metagenome]